MILPFSLTRSGLDTPCMRYCVMVQNTTHCSDSHNVKPPCHLSEEQLANVVRVLHGGPDYVMVGHHFKGVPCYI